MAKEGRWEFCERVKDTAAAMIFACTPDNRVLLVEEFRPPVGRRCLCFPAGLVGDESPESAAAAANRELEEETGYTAERWTPLGCYMPVAAYSDEIITLFLAEGLKKGEQRFDEDEFLEVFTLPLAEAAQACLDGRIMDGKTVAGILRAYYGK